MADDIDDFWNGVPSREDAEVERSILYAYMGEKILKIWLKADISDKLFMIVKDITSGNELRILHKI